MEHRKYLKHKVYWMKFDAYLGYRQKATSYDMATGSVRYGPMGSSGPISPRAIEAFGEAFYRLLADTPPEPWWRWRNRKKVKAKRNFKSQNYGRAVQLGVEAGMDEEALLGVAMLLFPDMD